MEVSKIYLLGNSTINFYHLCSYPMGPYPDLDITKRLDQSSDGFKLSLEEQMIEITNNKEISSS